MIANVQLPCCWKWVDFFRSLESLYIQELGHGGPPDPVCAGMSCAGAELGGGGFGATQYMVLVGNPQGGSRP